ncbi:DNA-binding response regulator [Nitrospira sp.]|nr:DNA-binding response regulator [Nitrospira sp.]
MVPPIEIDDGQNVGFSPGLLPLNAEHSCVGSRMPEVSLPARKLVVACTNVWQLAGLRAVLSSWAQFVVVAEATTPHAAIECIKRYDPTVLLVDLESWGKQTLSFLQDVRAFNQHIHVVLLSDLENPGLMKEAMDLDVAAVVLKVQPTHVLLRQLELLDSIPVKSTQQKQKAQGTELIKGALSGEDNAVRARIQRLTDREREIIDYIGKGLTNKEIAIRLDISFITVRHHLSRIFSKLGTDNRQKLLLFAHANQLVHRQTPRDDDVSSLRG